jgi:hypothetical protein
LSRERHWTGDESRSHGRYSFLGIIGRVIVSDLAAFAHHRGYAGGCPLAMNSPSSRHTAATCGFGGRARRAFIGRHKREGHHLPNCAVVARAAPPDVTVDRTSHTSKSRGARASARCSRGSVWQRAAAVISSHQRGGYRLHSPHPPFISRNAWEGYRLAAGGTSPPLPPWQPPVYRAVTLKVRWRRRPVV